MSEMVERVAKAICHYAMGLSDYNSCCSGPIKECQHKARVAIETMREPTEAMVEAALLAGTNLTVHGPSERLGKRTAGERMADQLRAAIAEALK